MFSKTPYPDELTFDEFDAFGFDFSKQFGLEDDRPNGLIAADVKKYADEHNCQIYTQVDGDKDCVYSRGLRFVNRTGLYEVVRKDGYQIDN